MPKKRKTKRKPKIKIAENVSSALEILCRNKSLSEISRDSGVSASFLSRLRSGEANFEEMKISTIEKIFPYARIDISGTGATATAGGIPLSRAEEKLVEVFRTIPEEFRLKEFPGLAPGDKRRNDQKYRLTEDIEHIPYYRGRG